MLHTVRVERSPVSVEFLMLIGVPGSGKSTLCEFLRAQNPRVYLISTDAIRAELFGDASYQGPWPLIWREIERRLDQAVTQSRHGSACGAIYDATNAVRRHRKAVLHAAIASGFTRLSGLWLDPPIETCLSHNRMRERQVPEQVIRQMQRQLRTDPPTLAEGFSRLVHYQHFPVGKLHPKHP